jgi:hypothetical protein
MHIRLTVLAAVLCGASFGCATPADEPGAAAQQQPRETGSYRTGSRLPSPEVTSGASSVGNVSKDDYIDAQRRSMTPIYDR